MLPKPSFLGLVHEMLYVYLSDRCVVCCNSNGPVHQQVLTVVGLHRVSTPPNRSKVEQKKNNITIGHIFVCSAKKSSLTLPLASCCRSWLCNFYSIEANWNLTTELNLLYCWPPVQIGQERCEYWNDLLKSYIFSLNGMALKLISLFIGKNFVVILWIHRPWFEG